MPHDTPPRAVLEAPAFGIALLLLPLACSAHADFPKKRCCATACAFVAPPLLAHVAWGCLAVVLCSHARVRLLQHPAPRMSQTPPPPQQPAHPHVQRLLVCHPNTFPPAIHPHQDHAITSDEALALEALPAAPIVVLGAGWVNEGREWRGGLRGVDCVAGGLEGSGPCTASPGLNGTSVMMGLGV